MKPLTLEEFAQELRRKGDYRESEFGDEILALLDIEAEVAEPHSNLCDDVAHYAPEGMKENPARAVEWLGDRSKLLTEIEDQLKEAQREGAADDAVKELLGTMVEAEAILEAAGWPFGGDFIEALNGLAERAARAPEEIEVMTYDL